MTNIETVAMPRPRKARRAKQRVPQRILDAAKAYKQAYLNVYGVKPTMGYDGKWIRIKGQTAGVSLKRLKELTTQLGHRRGH